MLGVKLENFYMNIKEESKIYTNYNLIFNKVENDKHLENFFFLISEIFEREMKFTITQLKDMKSKNSEIDIKHYLKKNIYIFKENLKLIILSSIEEIFKLSIEEEKIDKFLKNEIFGNFEVIEELDEEAECTEINSFRNSQFPEDSEIFGKKRKLSYDDDKKKKILDLKEDFKIGIEVNGLSEKKLKSFIEKENDEFENGEIQINSFEKNERNHSADKNERNHSVDKNDKFLNIKVLKNEDNSLNDDKSLNKDNYLKNKMHFKNGDINLFLKKKKEKFFETKSEDRKKNKKFEKDQGKFNYNSIKKKIKTKKSNLEISKIKKCSKKNKFKRKNLANNFLFKKTKIKKKLNIPKKKLKKKNLETKNLSKILESLKEFNFKFKKKINFYKFENPKKKYFSKKLLKEKKLFPINTSYRKNSEEKFQIVNNSWTKNFNSNS